MAETAQLMKRDDARTEILGRHFLIAELMKAQIEVAMPIRDHGVDLIAYVDKVEYVKKFTALPLQLKCSLDSAFAIRKRYEEFPNLLLVYVWGLRENSEIERAIYGLSYQQALCAMDVAKQKSKKGWKESKSWTGKQERYADNSPSPELIALFNNEYKMTATKWREKLGMLP